MNLFKRIAALAALILPMIAAAEAVKVKATLSAGPRDTVVATFTPSRDDPVPNVTDKLEVTLDCADGIDCADYSVYLQQEGADGVGSRGDGVGNVWTFSTDAWIAGVAKADIVVADVDGNNAAEGSLPVNRVTATNTGTAAPSKDPKTTDLTALLVHDCRPEVSALPSSHYWADRNRARFVVTPTGNVLGRPAQVIDEDDTVEVVVVAHRDLLPHVTVRRLSAFRTPGTISFVGGGEKIPANFATKAGTGESVCGSRNFELSDFAPGRAEVGIFVLAKDNKEVRTGSFDFGINTLYAGAFSLGPMWTRLEDPTFGLVNNGAGNVVTQTENGDYQVKYVLAYTPFLPRKRDLEKELGRVHVNPMIGILLDDVEDNAMLGLSVDYGSAIYLNVGWHLGRVKKLDPNSKVAVGSAFAGTPAEIPTTTEWDGDLAVGLTIDLRAAAKFFGFAGKAAAP